MANQVPIKAIVNLGNVTGLAEFQSADTIGIVDGGTGAADAASARTNLGLGNTSSPTFNGITINGDLVIAGTTTTIDSSTIQVEDPLIKLGRLNTTNIVDIGWYGTYSTDGGTTQKYAGIFRDATDSKFRVFQDTTVEPTTTVDIAGAGISTATLVANVEGNVIGQISDLSNHTTTDIIEGTNLYYTDVRVQLNRLDQLASPNIDVSMANFKITNLATPTLNTDGATKLYADTTAADAATAMSIALG